MKPRELALTLVILAVEVGGLALIAVGAALIYFPAGLIVGGVGLVLLALAAQMGGGHAG